jgi:hypothetical protein
MEPVEDIADDLQIAGAFSARTTRTTNQLELKNGRCFPYLGIAYANNGFLCQGHRK